MSVILKTLSSWLGNIQQFAAPINNGHGEYLIFSGESEAQVDRAVFKKAYQVFQQYPIGTHNRYELISKAVKQIDPNLKVAFIPRTLYELFFIVKVIKEDLKAGVDCPFLDRKFEKKAQLSIRKNCWHQCYFEDKENANVQAAEVSDAAYRLNRALVKELVPGVRGFTLQELEHHAENKINYLKRHHAYLERYQSIEPPIKLGPVINFSIEIDRHPHKPMGIRDNQKDEQIIRNALQLECSEIAQRCFLLYRGADLKEDSPRRYSGRAYSLSYGTSLFAGSVYDGGATAFHCMRNAKEAFVIPVPFEEMQNSPFYYPRMNAVAQLNGNGEIFHARSKVWKECSSVQMIMGVQGVTKVRTDHLKSDLSEQDLCSQFEAYKNRAIHLI